MAQRTLSLDGEDIDLSDMVQKTSERPIFRGSYSDVFQGQYDGNEVAIKVIKRVTDKDHKMKRKLYREGKVWASLCHPNILPLYGMAKGWGEFGAFISPWCPNKDAAAYLSTEQGQNFDFQRRLSLWIGVIEGVAYLHSNGIIHGDLKPRNVIIDNDGTPKICDFGLVRVFLEDSASGMSTTSTHHGTYRYLSPEMLDSGAKPTGFSDIWALGCIGLEVIYKRVPYFEKSEVGALARIEAGIKPSTRLDISSDTNMMIWNILDLCWNEVPEERPSADSIHAHLISIQEPPVMTHSGPGMIQGQEFIQSPDNTGPSHNEPRRRNSTSSDNRPSASQSHSNSNPRPQLPIRALSSSGFGEGQLPLLNEVAQLLHLSINWHGGSVGTDNRPVWIAIGRINGKDICEGEGVKKRRAKDQAAGALISYLTEQTGVYNPSRDSLAQALRNLLE